MICICFSFIAASASAAAIYYSAFSQTLEYEGWEVHTQLEDPTGPPLEDYPDEDWKKAELSRRLQELDESLTKRALILKTSHIGGHKYAGNVIVSNTVLLSNCHQKMMCALGADFDAARLYNRFICPRALVYGTVV
jgi:hypothetical protein